MPTTEDLRLRLIEKLKELFQLNQPDLDFGFYRIMHAKAQQVSDFLDRDLICIAEGAFGAANAQKMAQLQQAYEAALTSAREFGIANPEETEPVKRAKAAMEAATDTAKSEAEVYDHLYRFFERYYDNGDFISRRYYARETGGKAAPYAVPYNGEEVKLHWANADQYYIKTAEYFSNFSFDLLKSEEAQKARGDLFAGAETQPWRVHFQIVEATEGEHGNVKATEQTRRFFLIHKADPVGFNEAGELVCRFEYRPDPAKSGQEGSWRDRRNEEAVETILKALEARAKSDKNASGYLALLKIPAPTEKQKDRPLLAKYINQYTARNTMDYFIHKDLGSFLRRELDFYIKNEVMRLDDIEAADAPQAEQYLSKIRVLRQIAGKIIAMLTQLEDFQKKLWLKKKFVVETQYCLTLDRIPEAFYPEIAANDAQREEWVRLFAIDEIEGDLHVPAYSAPLTPAFLKANPFLVLDTRLFDASFKDRLIEAIEDFDEQCDGVLVHSENFQALNLLRERYRKIINCIYVDPPYNRTDDDFVYKDGFKQSSWLAAIFDRLMIGWEFLPSLGCYYASIGREEFATFQLLFDTIVGPENRLAELVWEKGRKNDAKFFSLGHDYIIALIKDRFALENSGEVWRELKPGAEEILAEYRQLKLEHGEDFETIKKRIRAFYSKLPKGHPALKHRRYNRIDKNGIWRDDNISWPKPTGGPRYEVIHPLLGKPVAIPDTGWRFATKKKFDLYLKHGFIEFREDLKPPFLKRYLNYVPLDFDPEARRRGASITESEDENGSNVQVMPSVFYKSQQPTIKEFKAILGEVSFSNPKDTGVIARIIGYTAKKPQAHILDYFAGSGTTAHAVINLNREDGGCRKYILVEMGDYFDTVLKPRIQKVIYAKDWKDGKPQSRNTGISHCFKYLRLESYEDCLNNLVLIDDPARARAIAQSPAFREDYLLRYMLDVETRGSQSLLNLDAFADPAAYALKVKKPGTDAYDWKTVDLVETFNCLIGLRVAHVAAPQSFTANFKRLAIPICPKTSKPGLWWMAKSGRMPGARGGFAKWKAGCRAMPIIPTMATAKRCSLSGASSRAIWKKTI